jgi:hypothetical protein
LIDHDSGTVNAEMTSTITHHRFRKATITGIFLIGPFILFTQYIWKLAFINFGVPGVYWLFVILDRLSLFLLESLLLQFKITVLVSSIVLILVLLVIKFIFPANRNRLNLLTGVLLSIGIALILTLPVVFAMSTTHLEGLRIDNRVYYLGAYPFVDIDYTVVECDRFGVFCRTIYFSYDITNTKMEMSHLNYDPQTRQLSLDEYSEGVIFTYAVP